MATKEESKLTGTIQHLIFYNHFGKSRIRMKPASVKRTPASVNSGFNFGKASRISKQIREAVAAIVPRDSRSRTMFRFTGALNRMINWKEKQHPSSPDIQKALPYVSSFQFNDQCEIPLILRPEIQSPKHGLIEVLFPPFVSAETLHAPYYTDHITFKFIVTSTSPTGLETVNTDLTEIQIPYQHALFQLPAFSLSLKNDPGRLILMVLSIEYFVIKKQGIVRVTEPRKMPCGVVWAGFQT